MTTSKVEYLGGLRTKCTHIKSGSIIETDAPVDNNGKGETFSPTDLVATAYGSCMLTIIGIYCQSRGLEFENGVVNVTKSMASAPRRIDCLELEIDLSGNSWSSEDEKGIERAANACPVAKSVDQGMNIKMTYKF